MELLRVPPLYLLCTSLRFSMPERAWDGWAGFDLSSIRLRSESRTARRVRRGTSAAADDEAARQQPLY